MAPTSAWRTRNARAGWWRVPADDRRGFQRGGAVSSLSAQKLTSLDLQELAERATARCRVELDDRSGLARIVAELITAGGKRVRPVVTYLVGACQGLEPRVLDAPAAISELVHTASLLHDDFIDGAVVRRSRPAAWVSFGPHDAVLAGDLALTIAMRLAEPGPAEARLRLLRVIELMTEAQSAERRARDGAIADVDGWLEIAEGKTAALLGWCAEVPALHAGKNEDCAALRSMGEGFGLAFQAVDDLLDLVPVHVAGKPACTDLRARVASLPIRMAAQHDAALERRIRAFWAGESDDVEVIAGQAFQSSVDRLVDFVDGQFLRVRAGLELLGAHPAREALGHRLDVVRHRMDAVRRAGVAWTAAGVGRDAAGQPTPTQRAGR